MALEQNCEEFIIKSAQTFIQDWVPFWEDVPVSHGTQDRSSMARFSGSSPVLPMSSSTPKENPILPLHIIPCKYRAPKTQAYMQCLKLIRAMFQLCYADPWKG